MLTTVRHPATRVPAAQLLAERVAAVRLPAPGHRNHRPGPHPGFGPTVVGVVTDRGIERVLARLQAGEVPARLVWAARSPRASYGDALVEEVLAAPCGVTVWDVARFGEPDLVRLAYAAYVSSGAAGVVCVAERSGRLVRALRSRGVPAHGSPRVV